MKIILAALDMARHEPNPLADAWEDYCGDLDCVEIHRGSILECDTDAVVSPANSFGFMDGGIDSLYDRYFGPKLQEDLQRFIREHHDGELLVGAAQIVNTFHDKIPYVIAAPTMRVPMILGDDSVSPYLAARAALLSVKKRMNANSSKILGPTLHTIAFPGLGTGVGRVSPQTCARQVRAAIDDVLNPPAFPRTWFDAQSRHQYLYSDQSRDLQYEV